MVKAVLYDLGDIFFEAHYWRKWMWETLTRIGKYKDDFCTFYNLYEKYLQPVYENRKEYWGAYKNFLEEMNLKNIDEFEKLSKLQKEFYEKNRVLYRDVEETLKKIHDKGIKNIVITDNENGSEWVRVNILAKFRVNDLVDLVVTSKETGVTKPDLKIFQHALDIYNLKKEEVLFVAHDKDEIDGAVDYGIKTIEFNNYLDLTNKAVLCMEKISDVTSYLGG